MKPPVRSSGKQGVISSPALAVQLALHTVLVVEDDGILAMAIEQTLRDHGVDHINICPTTEQALEALRVEEPDAIILDVHLADRDDGWAIAELVKSLGRAPRIIFSTGAPKDIPPHIAELGCVLTKPYSSQELVAALSPPSTRGILSRLKNVLS